METLVIRDIIPQVADESTSTPGRKFLQVIFRFLSDAGYLTTIRPTSRNFWDAYIGGRRKEDDAPLDIPADQLFISICEACGIDGDNIEKIQWEPGHKTFEKAIGMKVKGEMVKEYVEPYTIPGSLSKLVTRFTYSTVVLKGEDKYSVFQQQNHVIVEDEEQLKAIKSSSQQVASVNREAREERQHERGVKTSEERRGTGALVHERTLSADGMAMKGDVALHDDDGKRIVDKPETTNNEPVHTDAG